MDKLTQIMFYVFIISVWSFCVILSAESGQWYDGVATIKQLEANRNSLVFRITMNDTWPVSLSDPGVEFTSRCSAGLPTFPRLLDWDQLDENRYPVYKLYPPSIREKQFNYCSEERNWMPSLGNLTLLDSQNGIYEFRNLQPDTKYEISAKGYYSWSNNTAQKFQVSGVVYTESLDPPIIREGYFWVQNQTTSSIQRTVTLFWEKTGGEGVLEHFVENKQLPGSTKTISLTTGYLTTLISMEKNTFRFYKKSVFGNTAARFSSVDIPSNESIVPTSYWMNAYTQVNENKATIEWMQMQNITDIIVFWFNSDENVILFVRPPSTVKGITIEAPAPVAVGLSMNFATKSTGMVPLYGLDSMTEIKDLFSTRIHGTTDYPQMHIDDTEHVEKAQKASSTKIVSPNTRFIPSDMEHVDDVFIPKRPKSS